jgi:hypothetical protein
VLPKGAQSKEYLFFLTFLGRTHQDVLLFVEKKYLQPTKKWLKGIFNIFKR